MNGSRSNSRHRHRRPIPTASTLPVSRAMSHGGRRHCRRCARCAGRGALGRWILCPAAARARSVLQLPVVVESWRAFDALFAWDARPVGWAGEPAPATSARRCSFFANGGRRAVIVRCGDPWPISSLPVRAQRSAAPGWRPCWRPMPARWTCRAGSASPTRRPALRWRCCACLTCLISAPPSRRWSTSPSSRRFPRSLRRVFPPTPLRRWKRMSAARPAPPRADHAGFIAWRDALGSAARVLASWHREICCWRRCAADARRAQCRQLGAGGFPCLSRERRRARCARQQQRRPRRGKRLRAAAWPWLKTRHSADLPGTLRRPTAARRPAGNQRLGPRHLPLGGRHPARVGVGQRAAALLERHRQDPPIGWRSGVRDGTSVEGWTLHWTSPPAPTRPGARAG